MKEISPERKLLYYVGMGMTILGFILFFSTFVSFFMAFGNFGRINSLFSPYTMARPFIGVICIGFGGFLRRVAVRGVAGSGIILDPKRARQDLEPWSRMTGGIVQDVVDESGIKFSERKVMPFDEKLRRLEGLRKDGLLTEVEYQKKRDEVLGEKF